MGTLETIVHKTNVRQLGDSFNVVKRAWQKWMYGMQEYREYGLYHDDLYRDGHPVVAEAVRRLPEDVYTARVHRLHRAIQLSRNKIVLPQAMWTPQNDEKHHYLKEYMALVEKENAEKSDWNKK